MPRGPLIGQPSVNTRGLGAAPKSNESVIAGHATIRAQPQQYQQTFPRTVPGLADIGAATLRTNKRQHLRRPPSCRATKGRLYPMVVEKFSVLSALFFDIDGRIN
jgi:hypothetical protein